MNKVEDVGDAHGCAGVFFFYLSSYFNLTSNPSSL
jgi:hypothetical protein